MGPSMRNTYPHKLYTGVNSLWDTLKIMRDVCKCLTSALRSMLAGEPLRRIARKRSLVLLGALFVFSNTAPAMALNTINDINNYKLYTHIKLLDAKQYRCVELLWTRESQWDPRANNPKSSAFGIPQLLHLKVLDPYKQIDAGLAYIKHRHKTACKAWETFRSRGNY